MYVGVRSWYAGPMPLDREKIKSRRLKLGLSQEQAAEKAKLGGGRQQWSNIENGGDASITLTTLEKVAAALGVKAKDLLQ